jgi:hypothetical protein
VDQGDDVGAPVPPKGGELPPSRPVDGGLLKPGVDEREDDEDDPDVIKDNVKAVHKASIEIRL